MTATFTLDGSGVDPRPGDVLVVPTGEGWQVMTVEELVALDRLLPLGVRGERAFVPASAVMDSADPPWHGSVQLLVTLYLDVHPSDGDAIEAQRSGTPGPSVRPVLVDAGSLPATTVLVEPPASDAPADPHAR